MTREQIEAWLTLEGWVLTQSTDTRFVPFYLKDGEFIYHHHREGLMRGEHTPESFTRGFRENPDRMTYPQLQLIYQELIKHDTRTD